MKQSYEDAISPVVGVMLMLVVVIIIAAIVSGFAGGLMGTGNGNAPTLAMDVKVVNTGSFAGSGFFATVTGVSEPIQTQDLRIVTSWTAANGVTPISGGNTTQPGTGNINVLFDPAVTLTGYYVAPFGSGPGVGNGTETLGGIDTLRDFSAPGQQFGNYSLMAGTTLSAMPCGAKDGDSLGGTGTKATEGYGVDKRFTYSSGGPWLDATSSVLGLHWENLRIGDTVTIKVIHVPTGKVIFNRDVMVTEG
ncbi:type IV pilin [Methanoregula sp.]|uniref:type IV pilin n=1 Tax=Methanoregula sp. TaxID=2052170 RepID=UPI00236A7016|nr:type IV pilin [Methanoregula sp.]MDD1687874.1 type IV pilin [Methanoregula sp.]